MFQMFNSQKENLQTYLLINTESNKRTVYWIGENNQLLSRDFSEFVVSSGDSACNSYSDVNNKVINPNKASSFVDINSDCIPDLILETVQTSDQTNFLEFYLFRPSSQKFCLVSVEAIPQNYLMASFGDLSIPSLSRQRRHKRALPHQTRLQGRHFPQ